MSHRTITSDFDSGSNPLNQFTENRTRRAGALS
jgi:hypothetical protein